MAHDKGPCGPLYEDYEDLYRDYENKSSRADDAIVDAGLATAAALTACGVAGWTGVGTPLCIGLGIAALRADRRSIVASRARNEAADSANKVAEGYKDCVGKHKWYYGELK